MNPRTREGSSDLQATLIHQEWMKLTFARKVDRLEADKAPIRLQIQMAFPVRKGEAKPRLERTKQKRSQKRSGIGGKKTK